MDLIDIIDEISDHLLDDLILPWYKNVSNEQNTFVDLLK